MGTYAKLAMYQDTPLIFQLNSDSNLGPTVCEEGAVPT